MSATVTATPVVNLAATELGVGVTGLGNRSDDRRREKKRLRNGTGR
uniref:Uncharacterized protein n=1 Tax=Siphoviridae sp. ctBCr48 TaxID=2827802 RepID=A0A8S5SH47_9CAUD|nr:MAG TPA: hypothetical protein [Siphoviridae sp. ctBCr48]